MNLTGFMQFYFWPISILSKENVYADIVIKIEETFATKSHLYPFALNHFYAP